VYAEFQDSNYCVKHFPGHFNQVVDDHALEETFNHCSKTGRSVIDVHEKAEAVTPWHLTYHIKRNMILLLEYFCDIHTDVSLDISIKHKK